MTVARALIALTFLAAATLTACNNGATPPTGTTPPTDSGTTTFTPLEAQTQALKLWRDDDRTQHPKGSCSGCHGADFYDLARIGSTQTDILRRAKIDGATAQEAAALAQAIQQIRARDSLPLENPRTFRPFQPGGAVLPGATPIERDLSFARSLEPLLPTLFGARIDSLEKAKQARTELLDLISGDNAGGANSSRLNLRSLPTGIQYPLWSADLAQGESEGTLNDWLADIALDAKPEFKAQWHALQDTYLSDPSDQNFWKMYAAVPTMTVIKPFETCTTGGINPSLACGAVDDFVRHKLRSAMIGQHLMRTQHASRAGFVQGALAFSYLDSASYSAKTEFLGGNDLWEIGDRARVMLDENQSAGSLRSSLEALGLPKFVRESVSATDSVSAEQQRLRLTWFWIGFTFDPSFARISGSNSTKVGEYMVSSLIDENMGLHNAFSQHVRLIAKGYLQAANVKTSGGKLIPVTPAFLMDYGYFIGYGRPVLNWNEDRKNLLPTAQKLEQEGLWQRFVGNGFRMSMYLQIDALDTADAATKTKLLEGLRVITSGVTTQKWGAGAIKPFFDTYQPKYPSYTPAQYRADLDLMNALNAKIGVSSNY